MLTRSFQILPGLCSKTELKLKKQGITHWNLFLAASKIKGVSPKRKSYYDRLIIKAKHHLNNKDALYFSHLLPQKERWRLFGEFRSSAVFLDIESTGTSNDSSLTVVGLYDGLRTKTMINGVNLDLDSLSRELLQYSLVITFNGSSFDLPFLKKYCSHFPEMAHIDLRHCCSNLSLNGGLKEIEKELGIKRDPIIEKFSGGDPLKLWRMFRGSGDDFYLNLLIEYNEEDVFNLNKIMVYCYNKYCEMEEEENAIAA